MSDLKLRGALAYIEKRSRPSSDHNEFEQEPQVRFSATKEVLPSLSYNTGITTELNIRIGARLVTFSSDPPEARRMAEEQALERMSHHLYADVVDDLRGIMQAVGYGKRREAMTLLSALHRRLTGRDA